MHIIRFVTFAIAGLFSQPVWAQQLTDIVCDDRERIEKQLKASFDVVKQGQGLRGPESLLEVWIDQSSGDWTMVQRYANGRSCIVAMGQHWQVLEQDPA